MLGITVVAPIIAVIVGITAILAIETIAAIVATRARILSQPVSIASVNIASDAQELAIILDSMVRIIEVWANKAVIVLDAEKLGAVKGWLAAPNVTEPRRFQHRDKLTGIPIHTTENLASRPAQCPRGDMTFFRFQVGNGQIACAIDANGMA